MGNFNKGVYRKFMGVLEFMHEIKEKIYPFVGQIQIVWLCRMTIYN